MAIPSISKLSLSCTSVPAMIFLSSALRPLLPHVAALQVEQNKRFKLARLEPFRNPRIPCCVAHAPIRQEDQMATAKKTARGRKQDRARVAGGQDYEVRYEAKKTGRSASAVKKTVKKVGTSRKRVEKRLAR